jgi:signal transduction histidine kinase
VSGIAGSLRIGRVVALIAAATLIAAWFLGLALWVLRADSLPPVPFHPWSAPDGRAALAGWGVSTTGYVTYLALLGVLVVAASVVAAYLVLRGAVSWFRLYLAVALVLFATAGGHVPLVAGTLYPSLLPVAEWLQGLAWLALFPLAYVFPDGRFVPAWTRWLALVWPAYLAIAVVGDLLGAPEGPALTVAETVLVVALFGSCAGAQVYRYVKVSGPVERQQTKWLALAIVLWFGFGLILVVTPLRGLYFEASRAGVVVFAAGELVTAAILALIPAAIAAAIVRYRLFDVDIWISRALVYGVLTVFVVGAYALVVGGVGALWAGGGAALPVLATGLVAVAFHPIRVRAQRRIHRLIYGRRDDPYAVVAELGRRLASALPPDEVLQTTADTIGTALKLPHVSLTVGGDATGTATPSTAVYGSPPAGAAPAVVFPLRYHGEEIGELCILTRPEERLGGRDRGLIEEVARQAGMAVHAANLTADLRRSRERLATAREEERRRLHRDLHDGLGPTLASLYQRVDAARELIDRDPGTAQRLLEEVQAQTKRTIADVRQLVYSLRPPVLDELGLMPAIEEACRQLNPRPHQLTIEVRAPAALPELPAAVEVAAYRIAVEGVTNMVRHAGARRCDLRIAVVADRVDGTEPPYLLIEVADDGAGVAPDARMGAGLRTMRERAEEIGGNCTVRSHPPHGTVVCAKLPLDRG